LHFRQPLLTGCARRRVRRRACAVYSHCTVGQKRSSPAKASKTGVRCWHCGDAGRHIDIHIHRHVLRDSHAPLPRASPENVLTIIHGGNHSRKTHARSLADHAFRRSPIAALVAGLVVCAAPAAHAADDPALAELKAALERVQQENARINAENARLRQQLGGAAPAAAEAAAAPQDSVKADADADAAAAGAPAATLEGVTVRSRNRLAALQDVPTSASAVSGDELQRLAATSMRDITARAANVTRQNSSNARSSDLAIRGIGRKGSSEAQDPNVGITVDGVSYGYAGLSSWDFVDVDTVQVLRGPVGTLGGKNSNVGGLYLTTKKPSFTPGAEVSLTFGQRDGLLATTAITGPVIDDLLAWRGTFYIDKVRGKYKNAYDAGDSTYTDRNKLSGKVQFLFTPTNTFTALLSADRQPRTFENDNGLNFFHSPPATYSDGSSTDARKTAFAYGRLARDWFTRLGSYNYSQYANFDTGLQNNEEQRALLTGTQGASADLTWNLGDYTLRSITAFRNIYFDARNDEGTPFDISTQGGGGVRYKQLSQEIRLNSPVGGAVDYQVGVYAIKNRHEVDSKTGWGHDAGAWFANDAQYSSLNADSTGRLLLADSLDYARKLGTAVNQSFSPALYGQLNWHLSEPLTVTTGARVTHEHRTASNFAVIADPGVGAVLDGSNDAIAQRYYGVNYATLNATQQGQITNAKALRSTQFGKLFSTLSSDTINKTQVNFHLSLSLKFNEQVTGYISFQHGEKAGVAQVINGVSLNAKPEKTNNIELGVKNNLLERTLQLNADIFLSNIRDYQQQAYVLDPVASTALNPVYITTTGNAAKVRAKGLEVDAAYSGIRNTTLRFSGAYNDARYVSFVNSATPPEAKTAGVQDLSGQTLPGAAKYTGNIGGDYSLPVFGNRLFHADFNVAYTSRYNSDVTLSQYGWIKSYTITDLGIGFGRQDRGWDVTLLVKNAFNTEGKAYGFTSGTLDTTPRWLGVNFNSKL
jgi:outer membrane receptor protein involved in Fe transport